MLSVDRDVSMSKERNYLPKESKVLNFDSFCLVTIFELTDIFTRGCLKEEYLDFVRRLCVGLFIQKDGKLHWREDADITYKHWLATRRRGKLVRLTCRVSCLTQLPARSRVENEQVSGDEKRRNFAGLKTDIQTPVYTSAFILNDTISRIYRGKLVADLLINGNAAYEPIPFDTFVVRYFALQFGSKRAARRHLRVFVLSCKQHISTPESKYSNPRIDLFCTLAGLQLLPNVDEYNPRLASEYFFPALRLIFPNPRAIHDALREGKDNAAMLAMAVMEKASRPCVLNYIIGGELYLKRFKKQAFCLSKHDLKKGLRVVNFDFFMILALDLWVFADGFRSIREKRALGVLKRLFQRRKCSVSLKSAPPKPPAPPQATPEVEISPIVVAKKNVSPSKALHAKKLTSKPATKLAKVKALDKKINKSKYGKL